MMVAGWWVFIVILLTPGEYYPEGYTYPTRELCEQVRAIALHQRLPGQLVTECAQVPEIQQPDDQNTVPPPEQTRVRLRGGTMSHAGVDGQWPKTQDF